jgi:hypothetical protein
MNLTEIKIGQNAGQGQQQNSYTIAIGTNAGNVNQNTNSIAIGQSAGRNNQLPQAIAIGLDAGKNSQGPNAIAIGTLAGEYSQQLSSIAIGILAGQTGQGQNSIAIGNLAGQTSQPANSIILNASGDVLNGVSGQTGFYVKPIRRDLTQTTPLCYNSTTGEIVISTGGIGPTGPPGTSYNMNSTTVAIGNNAGQANQGTNSIAIGNNASPNGYFVNNTIVLNATGNVVTPLSHNGCFIAPIRSLSGNSTGNQPYAVFYNPYSKELFIN